MVHAIRDWINRSRGDPMTILLQKDIKNEFNEIFPEIFLDEYHRYAPSSARFAEWYYGTPSHLIYDRERSLSIRVGNRDIL